MKKLVLKSALGIASILLLSVYACGTDDEPTPSPTPTPAADTTKPTIEVTTSASSVNLAQQLTITVKIEDNTKLKEADVTFKSKGSPVFEQTWKITSADKSKTENLTVTVPPNRYVGVYDITAVVRDAAGNDANTSKTVTVNCPAGKAWCK